MHEHKKAGLTDIAVILLLLLIFALPLVFGSSLSAEYAEVLRDGEAIMRISLNQNGEYTPDGLSYPLTLSVRDGKIAVIQSGCPGKQCVDRGYAGRGEAIVCLPNRIIITIGGSDNEYDAVV